MWTVRVVCASERWWWGGDCSSIMQIHSRTVIRATEQVHILWINLMIGSGSNQILMGSNIGWDWDRFSPLILEQKTRATVSAQARCQPLGLRDEVTLNYATMRAHKHTHASHILLAKPFSNILTRHISSLIDRPLATTHSSPINYENSNSKS